MMLSSWNRHKAAKRARKYHRYLTEVWFVSSATTSKFHLYSQCFDSGNSPHDASECKEMSLASRVLLPNLNCELRLTEAFFNRSGNKLYIWKSGVDSSHNSTSSNDSNSYQVNTMLYYLIWPPPTWLSTYPLYLLLLNLTAQMILC
jgi:hypothetical protein